MDPYIVLAKEIQGGTFSALRRQNALTQEEMAERLHISCRAYSDLERGKYCVSAATLLFMLSMLSTAEQQTLLGQFVKCVQLAEEGSVA